jgi:hypothetical protein
MVGWVGEWVSGELGRSWRQMASVDDPTALPSRSVRVAAAGS